MTRDEYMSAEKLTDGAYDGSKGYDVHHAYFAQFVTSEVTETLLSYIRPERLLASRDIHLNDVPLHLWDNLPYLPIIMSKAKEFGDNTSLSTKVCVYKTAARLWLKANGGLPLWRIRYQYYPRMTGDPEHWIYSYAVGSTPESALIAFRGLNPQMAIYEMIAEKQMTAVEHIIAWIESSRPHYERLIELERDRKARTIAGTLTRYNEGLALRAFNIVSDAYREATRGGDMFREDHSPATILDAAKALLTWELEQ